MKPTAQEKRFSFKEVIGIFWEWRQASVSVEVCFFGKAESSDTVRVSIDGLVSLVDPEGIITVSGDGREIELDLRGCEFQHARDVPGRKDVFDPLDPDSILKVKFPNGEICLIFPYRRVAHSVLAHKRAASGLEWLRSKLGNPVTRAWTKRRDLEAGKAVGKTSLAGANDRSSKPGTSRTGPPLLPIASFLVIFLIVAFSLSPGSIPRLLFEIGLSRQSMSDPNAMVWAIRQEGNYYCSGSVLAGRKPGQFMKQADALTLGYQPAVGHYCGSATGSDATSQGGISAFFLELGQSGCRFFSRLLHLSRALLSGTGRQSASARPQPGAGGQGPRSARASLPKDLAMPGPSAAASAAGNTGGVAANSSSATLPVPGTPRP